MQDFTEDTPDELKEWIRVTRESLREVSKIIEAGNDIPKVAYRLLDALQEDIAILFDKLKAKHEQED